jgi:hypothetical protein
VVISAAGVLSGEEQKKEEEEKKAAQAGASGEDIWEVSLIQSRSLGMVPHEGIS